jgi:hypothetical protein
MSPFDIIPSSFFNKPWHRCVNGAGEEIPAYACMRITGATEIDNDIVFQVAKPNTDKQLFYLVNGPVAIENNSAAEGRCTTLSQAGYVSVSSSPSFGNIWGPTDGSWSVSSSGGGFLMLGSLQSDPSRAAAVQLPSEGEVVQVWTGSGSPVAGDLQAANGDGFHEGRVTRWVSGAFTANENCWIRMIDWDNTDDGATIAEHGRFHLGKLAGSAASGGTTKPLYLCQIGEQTFLSKPDADIAKGATGTVSLYNGDETDSGINKVAKALGAAVTSGKWTTTVRFRGGSWYVGCWETT